MKQAIRIFLDFMLVLGVAFIIVLVYMNWGVGVLVCWLVLDQFLSKFKGIGWVERKEPENTESVTVSFGGWELEEGDLILLDGKLLAVYLGENKSKNTEYFEILDGGHPYKLIGGSYPFSIGTLEKYEIDWFSLQPIYRSSLLPDTVYFVRDDESEEWNLVRHISGEIFIDVKTEKDSVISPFRLDGTVIYHLPR